MDDARFKLSAVVVLLVELLQAAKKKTTKPKKKNFFMEIFLTRMQIASRASTFARDHRMIFLKMLSLPLKGGYFIGGSNQVGVFIMDFR